MPDNKTIVRYYQDGKECAARYTTHVPAVGDEVKLSVNCSYVVTRRVWLLPVTSGCPEQVALDIQPVPAVRF